MQVNTNRMPATRENVDAVFDPRDLPEYKMQSVIPDLVSERSEAESVGNPGLGLGEAKADAE